jgi:hypothetical protein
MAFSALPHYSLSPSLVALLDHLNTPIELVRTSDQIPGLLTIGAELLPDGSLHVGTSYPLMARYDLCKTQSLLWTKLTSDDWSRIALVVIHSAAVEDEKSLACALWLLERKDLYLSCCRLDTNVLAKRFAHIRSFSGLRTHLRVRDFAPWTEL